MARQVPLRVVARVDDHNMQLFRPAESEEGLLEWWRAGGRPSYSLRLDEAEHLTRLCCGGDLTRVAGVAAFPDWLGYLGVVLHELRRFESCRFRIGHSWANQFIAMGGDVENWGRFEVEAMRWQDLEAAESERLGVAVH
jgi:hypothetical protein